MAFALGQQRVSGVRPASGSRRTAVVQAAYMKVGQYNVEVVGWIRPVDKASG